MIIFHDILAAWYINRIFFIYSQKENNSPDIGLYKQKTKEDMMIIEGIKLTVIGMVVVYVFLVLMVMIIHLFSRVLKSITEEEAALLDFQSRKKKKPSPAYDNKKITAIISAAIAAHRARFHQRT